MSGLLSDPSGHDPSGHDPSGADPLGLRRSAPLFDAYLRAAASQRTPFTIPGHKGRGDLIGDFITADVPLHGGVDTIGLDHGLLAAAEHAAASLWGVDWCRFSVGGSTHGNQALALAVARPGDSVIVSRTLHRSMFTGLILAGLRPIWITPWVDPVSGLPGGIDADRLAAVIDRHPDARAVFLGDPSYVGGHGDLDALSSTAHARDLPLIVDAAWAAIAGFHPAMFGHALARGADAIVTSAHKTLPAWSQAALVLANTASGRLDRHRLDAAFDIGHTTSPSGALLASLDAARALLEHHGVRLIGELLAQVERAADQLAALEGIRVVRGDWIDPTRLVIQLIPTTDGAVLDGRSIAARLVEAGMPVETADRTTLIPMITIADTADTVDALLAEVTAAATDPAMYLRADSVGPVDHGALRAVFDLEVDTVIDPREAFFAPHRVVALTDAVGEISAEIVAPYPPGIPVLAPGERITAAGVDALLAARAAGLRIATSGDQSLATIRIVDRRRTHR